MSGALKLGTVTVDAAGQLKVGSSNVEAVYLGATQIFPGTTTTTTTVPPTTTTTTSTTTTTTTEPTTTTTSTTTTTTTVPPTTTSTTTTTTTNANLREFFISAGEPIGTPGRCGLPTPTPVYAIVPGPAVLNNLDNEYLFTNPGLTTPFVGDPLLDYAIEYEAGAKIFQIDATGLTSNLANCY